MCPPRDLLGGVGLCLGVWQPCGRPRNNVLMFGVSLVLRSMHALNDSLPADEYIGELVGIEVDCGLPGVIWKFEKVMQAANTCNIVVHIALDYIRPVSTLIPDHRLEMYQSKNPTISKSHWRQAIAIMRLINCLTLRCQEFIGVDIPPYAILSHTWEKEEVLFEDLRSLESPIQKQGFEKIVQTCRLAIKDGYEYVWIDTCCIDKSSSAELTEAINSMFNWYKISRRCYVYLGDFQSRSATSDLSQCRWFTRGWTLQELVAPADIRFYDKDWRYFGSKSELGAALSTITGIERAILNGNVPLFAISVARKMSWASERETTREEDHAYCLLGVFGISMPLVYGEGARAFKRLQEEIIKETNDLTLFAWQAEPATSEVERYRGILALSPREFINAGVVIPITDQKNNPEFALTNKGLRIHVPLSHGPGNSVVMSLNCYRRTVGNEPVGIYLVDTGGGIFARDLPQKLASYTTGEVWKNEAIYIMKHV